MNKKYGDDSNVVLYVCDMDTIPRGILHNRMGCDKRQKRPLEYTELAVRW